jgi:hypothetical protein
VGIVVAVTVWEAGELLLISVTVESAILVCMSDEDELGIGLRETFAVGKIRSCEDGLGPIELLAADIVCLLLGSKERLDFKLVDPTTVKVESTWD